MSEWKEVKCNVVNRLGEFEPVAIENLGNQLVLCSTSAVNPAAAAPPASKIARATRASKKTEPSGRTESGKRALKRFSRGIRRPTKRTKPKPK